MTGLLDNILEFSFRLGAIALLLFFSSIAFAAVGYFVGWSPKETAELLPYVWCGLLVGRILAE
jgi:hypothetical protein